MNLDKMLRKENNNLNLLRVLLAIIVIYYHSFSIFDNNFDGEFFLKYTGMGIGSLSVKVFFFLSGMLVTKSYIKNPNPFEWLISRGLRIVPAYYVVILFTALVIGPTITSLDLNSYLSSPETHSFITGNATFETVFLLPGIPEGRVNGLNGSIWTIHFEVFFYLLFIITAVLFANRCRILFITILSVSFILPLIGQKDLIYESHDMQSYYLLLPCFSFGCIVACFSTSISRPNLKLACLILAAFMPVFKFFGWDMLFFYSMTIFTCIGCLLIFTTNVAISLNLKSDISYGVYLWGFTVQQLVFLYITKNFYYGFFISLLLSIVVGMISWEVIEKPSMGMKKKIQSRGRKPQLGITIDP
ncbi:acyltransferase family protein [Enterobacter roggenkampii]|uniref:acyltransferase family protein n=2 Tax=Enterobacter roggenkampii TaxID=1812935 RepID=UPI0029DCAB40|nr:acyltransferase [Enterobacter roggenkampii]MDX7478650.1 acyltransferase [Enterobacter roggenkampii]